MGLECLQKLHDLPGQPFPVLCHPHCKEVLPHVEVGLLVLYFMATAPRPVAAKGLVPSS